MSLLERIRVWSLRQNLRTWLMHRLIVWGGAFVHPLLAVYLAGWYKGREDGQVKASGKGWTVDSIADAAWPAVEAVTAVMLWFSSLALPWWIR